MTHMTPPPPAAMALRTLGTAEVVAAKATVAAATLREGVRCRAGAEEGSWVAANLVVEAEENGKRVEVVEANLEAEAANGGEGVAGVKEAAAGVGGREVAASGGGMGVAARSVWGAEEGLVAEAAGIGRSRWGEAAAVVKGTAVAEREAVGMATAEAEMVVAGAVVGRGGRARR